MTPTKQTVLFAVAVLLSGCIGDEPQADGDMIELQVSSGYDSAQRSYDSESHRSTDLPKGTPASDLVFSIIVKPIEGRQYGDWNFTPPCTQGSHNMATGESTESDCSTVRAADPVVLPPPDEDRFRLYVLDSGGTINLVSPEPLLLSVNINSPYSDSLKAQLDQDAECFDRGEPRAHLGSMVGEDTSETERRVEMQEDGKVDLRYFGVCDTGVS